MKIKFASIAIATLLLSACGGGGGSSSTPKQNINPPPVNNGPDAPVWTEGEFLGASGFKNYCEAPRSGNGFSDVDGTSMHEKMWIRSWSNETYLWYDEIADVDPTNYEVLAYFDTQKTTDTTSSGKPKDQFHFTYDTEEWEQLSQSGVVYGYGIEWAIISPTVPRKAVVVFTEPDTEARTKNITRGSELIEIDGIDFVNTNSQSDVNAINAALFPEELNQSHTFKFRAVDGEEFTVTMSSASIETSPVLTTKVIDTPTGNVGYMQFNSFIAPAEEQLYHSFGEFKQNNVTDLVLDLRYNSGGLLYMASQLGYMIAGDNTNGSLFYRFKFNDKINSEVIPYSTTTYGFADGFQAGLTLPTLNLNRVFILTTDSTCSASEAVMNGLLGSDVEVIQIGGTTCGKPYGFTGEDNCGTTYFTIQFSGDNAMGFGDYADGFSAINSSNPFADPNALVEGCEVSDDYSKPLGDVSERLLSTALSYRNNGSCPVQPVGAPANYQRATFSNQKMIKDNRISTLLRSNIIRGM
ncbi:S41 family peptidase [Thalassotalea sediminis]|uniref:S41 family peptidase n=1 Tax=Thalassotalea sediminis TaxID=1759089 RepID=UPI002573DFBA|nr:S41 family peptidase [Thalassotalea sediminis]